jgi:hypothetical protein
MRTSRGILSRAALLATLLVIVFAVAAGAGGVVAYASHTVNGDGTASFFYTVTVTADGAPNVSQVQFLVKNCFTLAEAGTWTAGFVKVPGSLPSVETICPGGGSSCRVIFHDDLVGVGTIANYYLTVNLGGANDFTPTGVQAEVRSLLPDGSSFIQTTDVPGPGCSPTAVTLADMRATAVGAPLAALGGLVLTGLAAFAALRHRAA